MQTNDLQTSIEDSLLRCLYVLGKIEPSNIIKPSKFDWERCSSSHCFVNVMLRNR